MILKILRLTLHSDAPMRGDGAKLRGFFATSFNEYALLHQHVTDKLIYRYPLIQYKMLDGSPLVLGINEGAEILKEIYDKFDEIKLGDSNYTIMERGVTVKSEEFGCTEEILSYRFASPWLALSQENYARYMSASLEDRKDLLQKNPGGQPSFRIQRAGVCGQGAYQAGAGKDAGRDLPAEGDQGDGFSRGVHHMLCHSGPHGPREVRLQRLWSGYKVEIDMRNPIFGP